MTHDHTAPTPASLTRLEQHLAHFQWRVLQDALAEATAGYWERRAATLEWARPRPGDHRGTLETPATVRARYDELTQTAANCRHHAALIRETGLDADAKTAIADLLAASTTGQVA